MGANKIYPGRRYNSQKDSHCFSQAYYDSSDFQTSLSEGTFRPPKKNTLSYDEIAVVIVFKLCDNLNFATTYFHLGNCYN